MNSTSDVVFVAVLLLFSLLFMDPYLLVGSALTLHKWPAEPPRFLTFFARRMRAYHLEHKPSDPIAGKGVLVLFAVLKVPVVMLLVIYGPLDTAVLVEKLLAAVYLVAVGLLVFWFRRVIRRGQDRRDRGERPS